MGRITTILLVLLEMVVLSSAARGVTYRVGPYEDHLTISEVTGVLGPGDVVEVTGDLVDTATLVRSGLQERPIVIRGIARIDKGRVIRPRIRPRDFAAFDCRGNWNVIENLDIDGTGRDPSQKTFGMAHDCDNLTIRNCYFHHFSFKAIVGSENAGSITIEFCEFDSCGSIPLNGKTVDIWSWKAGSVMRVEHCYFHDALAQCHLKTHCPRNIIRYNWFENAYSESLNITDRLVLLSPERPEGSYPMHSDVVGNVFIQGASPGLRYSTLSTGGHGPEEPGPEGDLTFAHNLLIMDVFGPANDPTVFDLVQGDVDHVKMYNNVFLQIGGRACLVYLRDLTWDTPEIREFIKRRGSPDPIVDGSNNWISERSAGIPEPFKNTLRGLNPKLVDLLNSDYRPRPDSPLAGAGLWPLPKGQIVDLVPEYEPQRGIPADLKPKPRRKATPPSIGPFEVPEELLKAH
jgi:hypothetical protein